MRKPGACLSGSTANSKASSTGKKNATPAGVAFDRAGCRFDPAGILQRECVADCRLRVHRAGPVALSWLLHFIRPRVSPVEPCGVPFRFAVQANRWAGGTSPPHRLLGVGTPHSPSYTQCRRHPVHQANSLRGRVSDSPRRRPPVGPPMPFGQLGSTLSEAAPSGASIRKRAGLDSSSATHCQLPAVGCASAEPTPFSYPRLRSPGDIRTTDRHRSYPTSLATL